MGGVRLSRCSWCRSGCRRNSSRHDVLLRFGPSSASLEDNGSVYGLRAACLVTCRRRATFLFSVEPAIVHYQRRACAAWTRYRWRYNVYSRTTNDHIFIMISHQLEDDPCALSSGPLPRLKTFCCDLGISSSTRCLGHGCS